MQILQSKSEIQTEAIGRLLGEKLFRGSFITLSGELGAGKTVFVRGLARGLQIDGPVRSPSFILMNQYENGRLPLYHFDIYRLSHVDDMNMLGYEEYFYGNGVSVVEWPQLITELLPKERLDIEILYLDDESREIRFEAYSPSYKTLLKDMVKEYEASMP